MLAPVFMPAVGLVSNSEINGQYSELNVQGVGRLESLCYMDLMVLDGLYYGVRWISEIRDTKMRESLSYAFYTKPAARVSIASP